MDEQLQPDTTMSTDRFPFDDNPDDELSALLNDQSHALSSSPQRQEAFPEVLPPQRQHEFVTPEPVKRKRPRQANSFVRKLQDGVLAATEKYRQKTDRPQAYLDECMERARLRVEDIVEHLGDRESGDVDVEELSVSQRRDLLGEISAVKGLSAKLVKKWFDHSKNPKMTRILIWLTEAGEPSD